MLLGREMLLTCLGVSNVRRNLSLKVHACDN